MTLKRFAVMFVILSMAACTTALPRRGVVYRPGKVSSGDVADGDANAACLEWRSQATRLREEKDSLRASLESLKAQLLKESQRCSQSSGDRASKGSSGVQKAGKKSGGPVSDGKAAASGAASEAAMSGVRPLSAQRHSVSDAP